MSQQGYLPERVNTGAWVNAYTLFHLQQLPADSRFVLPICSMSTRYADLETDNALLLPPLFHEALTSDLKAKLIAQIQHCFPLHGRPTENARRLAVVEHPREQLPAVEPASVIAFSVDTAVEEHGPHLPLGTDTIQSYSVLQALAESRPQLEICRPLEYGQLTWGLPFGFSVNLTADLLSQYVTGYTNALLTWKQPQAVYVVDVHGSITHRQAIVDGLSASNCQRWAFRWLHEPLAEFSSARGDQHAGGVETALVELAGNNLIDRSWFPCRESEIEAGTMTLQQAVELTPDLDRFKRFVQQHSANGIVGSANNYHHVDAREMFDRMLHLATQDLDQLCEGNSIGEQDAGAKLW